ncbi:hypothetical protein DOJK_01666 [Patescibacteria group bacterium]|nr:hypothetical protein DOJK_01666 [Patescibacteria group bacterium]
MNKKHFILAAILLTLFIVAYFFYDYITLKNNIANPDYINQLQITYNANSSKSVLEKLSQIMILPNEKDPTIATIKDVQKLKSGNPEFYKNALDGDTLIIYTSMAIIYRESENKIVSFAPVLAD